MANRNEYYKKYYEKTKENLLIKCREKVMCNICNKEINLSLALEFTLKSKDIIDNLKQILLSKEYQDDRILNLSTTMMSLSDFNPSLVTMENIMASGEFELINDIELRKQIISTYHTYEGTSKLEELLMNYINTYLTPFFFNNIRFSDFSSINADFVKDPLFENIVFGYEVLLNQQIKGYKTSLEEVKLLAINLTIAINKN